MKKNQMTKSGAKLLIFLGWLVYTTSYFGKVNYSANITQIIDFYNVTKSEAGLVPTFFFFAYGIGQVINGFLCKKYNMKWMIFASLILSSTINFIIAVTNDFYIIKWLWMANGFLLSILWPTIIRLLAEVLPQKDLGRSSVIIGTSVATGTLIIYGLSSIYANFNKFKYAFYTASFAGAIVGVIWLLLYKFAVVGAKNEKEKEQLIINEMQQEKVSKTKKERNLIYISIYILFFCAIGVNLIKDGLTTWVPSILKEEYNIMDSISILLTLFLPVVAIFGNMFALKVHKKIPDYVTHCFVMFVIMAGFIGMIIGSLTLKNVICMFIGLMVVSFLSSSLNSMITSIFPIFMRGEVNSGLYAGLLNGFCYLGSTISSYGLGYIAEHFGWTSVFWVLISFCVVVAVIWCVYALIKHHILNKV